MAKVMLPIQEAIRDLVGDLLGKAVGVDKAGEPLPEEDVVAIVAYRGDDGTLMALFTADRDLVAILGAALVMMPPPGLAEILRQPAVPENIYENFYEVTNIMTSLLNRPGGPHIVQAERLNDPAEATGDIRKALDAPAKKRYYNVTVVNYGSGRLALLAA